LPAKDDNLSGVAAVALKIRFFTVTIKASRGLRRDRFRRPPAPSPVLHLQSPRAPGVIPSGPRSFAPAMTWNPSSGS